MRSARDIPDRSAIGQIDRIRRLAYHIFQASRRRGLALASAYPVYRAKNSKWQASHGDFGL